MEEIDSERKYRSEIHVLTVEKRKWADSTLNVHAEAWSKAGSKWVRVLDEGKMELCVGVWTSPPGRMSTSTCGARAALMPDVLLSYINCMHLLIHTYWRPIPHYTFFQVLEAGAWIKKIISATLLGRPTWKHVIRTCFWKMPLNGFSAAGMEDTRPRYHLGRYWNGPRHWWHRWRRSSLRQQHHEDMLEEEYWLAMHLGWRIYNSWEELHLTETSTSLHEALRRSAVPLANLKSTRGELDLEGVADGHLKANHRNKHA